jgi:acylglycerol lipase
MYTPYGFDYYAEQFAENGICSVGIDIRGFGRSEGLKGYVGSIEDIVNDNLKFIDTLKKKDKELASVPLFLMGHSMGALSSAYMMLKYPHIARGLILFSPPFHPKGRSEKWQKLLNPFIPFIYPFRKCSLGKFGHEPGAPVDEEVKMLKYDPLIYKGELLYWFVYSL